VSDARLIIGDVFEAMASLPDGSVDLILGSPPFLALRSYLPPGHPLKGKEIGGERNPGEFIDTMLDCTEEWRRLLAPHGSIAIEFGDTYSGSGGAGGDYYNEAGLRAGQLHPPGANRLRDGRRTADEIRAGMDRTNRHQRRYELVEPGRTGPGRTRKAREDWPLDKSLCMIPELFRVALAYGINPLTGRETPMWRCRNVVRWCRPNPPVGALSDKVRPATSDLLIACVGRARYFDLEAIRSDHKPDSRGAAAGFSNRDKAATDRNPTHGWGDRVGGSVNPGGAPPNDHWWFDEEWRDENGDVFEQDAWLIPTAPYKGAHYATWPPELLIRPIEAMCPRRVCRECGLPSERIVEVEHEANRSTNGPQSAERKHLEGGSAGYEVRADRVARTVGWSDCGHNAWRRGVVLDPFAGSGTTLSVAVGHGRDAIGIDLDERNVDLVRQRVGMFLTVEELAAAS
jgi:hypothetical protein